MTLYQKTGIGLVLCFLLIALRTYGQDREVARAGLLALIAKDSGQGKSGIVIFENNGEESTNIFFQGMACENKAVTDSSIFNIGSCTKTYIATLVLMLEEEGKLNIDSSLDNYIDVKQKRINQKVTIRSLLNHTSNIPDFETSEGYINAILNSKEVYQPSQIFRYIQKHKTCKGNARYCYNNLGYFILGLMIENITQMPLDVVLQKYIFERLSLKNTSFYFPIQNKNSVCPGYELLTDVKQKINYINLNNLTFSAGNIYTNVFDLDRFVRKLFIEKSLLKPGSLKKMLEAIQINPMNNYSAGLGVYCSTPMQTYMISHTGRLLMGYTSLYACFPELNYSVVILRNNLIQDYENKSNLLNDLLIFLIKNRLKK